MPMTASTLAGGGTYRQIFGLNSSSSTDGTALSLTVAHGLAGLDATTATRLVKTTFEAHSAAAAQQGWFVASVDGTNIIFGRGTGAASPGETTTALMQANVELVHTIQR